MCVRFLKLWITFLVVKKESGAFPLCYCTNLLHFVSGSQVGEGGKEEQAPAKRARQMSDGDDDDDDDKEDESSVSVVMLFWNCKAVSPPTPAPTPFRFDPCSL